METNEIKQKLAALTTERFACQPDACTDAQLYHALLALTQQLAAGRPAPAGERKLYYFSAEFLMGKLLSNNLLALGLFGPVRALLDEMGRSLAALEEYEPEPSLGNGGLGRLAACFLDSIAALDLPGDGVGLNYHYGLFHQKFVDRRQQEQPDPWIEPESWLLPTGKTYTVPFGGFALDAVLYDIAVPGAHSEVANRLHLFDVADPAQPPAHGIDFDKRDIPHCLTSFLYPDDSDRDGQLLRVYQQYFMVSAGAQLILDELAARGFGPDALSEHVAIQINDTHPSMVIPELIRLLTEKGLTFDAAVEQVEKTCAYTNHTILAEALEKWPLDYIQTVAPQIVPIIQELDRRARQRSGDGRVAILDEGGRVHMAHMDIHYGHSVNGVAALHTDILKTSELKPFYDLYPEKFNNKTNGVTFRRWLEACDPALSHWITQRIGDGWTRDAARLEQLLPFADDPESLASLLEVKQHNKRKLQALLRQRQGVEVDENSIFDIQVKRLHEYKRQHMNALHILSVYQWLLENPNAEYTPHTYFFGAKAAPGYYFAKEILQFVVCLANTINNDPRVNQKLRVIFVENYCVSWAELLTPAAEISEQISLAGTEASGTSNMKFMINGAITLGTLDGANVEIHEAVGDDNIILFGMTTPEVNSLRASGYRPRNQYENNAIIRKAVDALGHGFDGKTFSNLHQALLNVDQYMALADFASYSEAQQRAERLYKDQKKWNAMSLVNTAKAGIFAADRAIRDYANNIWLAEPVKTASTANTKKKA